MCTSSFQMHGEYIYQVHVIHNSAPNTTNIRIAEKSDRLWHIHICKIKSVPMSLGKNQSTEKIIYIFDSDLVWRMQLMII